MQSAMALLTMAPVQLLACRRSWVGTYAEMSHMRSSVIAAGLCRSPSADECDASTRWRTCSHR